jgi:hypothetical protein
MSVGASARPNRPFPFAALVSLHCTPFHSILCNSIFSRLRSWFNSNSGKIESRPIDSNKIGIEWANSTESTRQFRNPVPTMLVFLLCCRYGA